MPLPDDIIVYPGHGAGSACGKNIGKETFDTLGNQKKEKLGFTKYLKRWVCKRSNHRFIATSAIFPEECFIKQTWL